MRNSYLRHWIVSNNILYMGFDISKKNIWHCDSRWNYCFLSRFILHQKWLTRHIHIFDLIQFVEHINFGHCNMCVLNSIRYQIDSEPHKKAIYSCFTILILHADSPRLDMHWMWLFSKPSMQLQQSQNVWSCLYLNQWSAT